MNLAGIIAFIAAFFSGALGFIVSWRGRGAAYLSFAAGMFVLAIESVLNGLGFDAVSSEEKFFWEKCSLVAMSFLPCAWLFFSLSYGRGNHREVLRRWRFMLALAFIISAGLAILYQGKLIVSTGQTNGRWMFVLGRAGVALNLIYLVSAILILMNLERTFRAAIGTMRWRIKYMIIGLGILFAFRSYTATQAILFHTLDTSLQALNAVVLLAACALIFRSLFRSGHFDVDIYPSHSILKNSLTALLAGIYLLVIGIFANVVALLGGDNAFMAKAFFILIALVLLTVLLLSDRVRLRASYFISRHFQRPLYDYRELWRKFTIGTAPCIGENALCQATIKLGADIFHVLSVTIWLVDEKHEQLNFAASTSLCGSETRELNLKTDEAGQLLNTLIKKSGPFDIDLTEEKCAAVLKRIHPPIFAEGGHRICAPLVVGGELLGLMILGDRIGGVPFSGQDFDLLKCIANEVAAKLLNVRLSNKLLQAREFEALQAMSAFFVHDLKNAASTLNLTLQNLPMHFDDPAFRGDALRSVSKSAAHINHLIERLTLFRHELKIKPIQGNFNEWLSKSLADFKKHSSVNLITEFNPVPRIFFDPEQLYKVLANLTLNAMEASSDGGQICIRTNQINGWAVLSVSDNGCGMRPDFVSQSLYRPFQTTKRNGLGIGMFQSKMIVEAHSGKIEVQSEVGKGTTFQIYLPVKK